MAVSHVVEAKRQWVLAKLRHAQKYREHPHPPGREIVNGESVPYLGTDYRIEISETPSGEVEFSGAFLVPPSHRTKRREVLRAWYVARANERILAVSNSTRRNLALSSVMPRSSIIAIAGAHVPSRAM